MGEKKTSPFTKKKEILNCTNMILQFMQKIYSYIDKSVALCIFKNYLFTLQYSIFHSKLQDNSRREINIFFSSHTITKINQ
uniref:Uncharacterized protein n=1 Tax=Pyxicephalus adspersus TaxID=30357 RepID=A0AAV3AKV1_PYXAD|nr:TPA: hypothetical protein GDO54_012644 [Pyxicephalus adspersus]